MSLVYTFFIQAEAEEGEWEKERQKKKEKKKRFVFYFCTFKKTGKFSVLKGLISVFLKDRFEILHF